MGKRRKSEPPLPSVARSREEIEQQFDSEVAILVRVQHPRRGCGPDWFLCKHSEEFFAIVDEVKSPALFFLLGVDDIPDLPEEGGYEK